MLSIKATHLVFLIVAPLAGPFRKIPQKWVIATSTCIRTVRNWFTTSVSA